MAIVRLAFMQKDDIAGGPWWSTHCTSVGGGGLTNILNHVCLDMMPSAQVKVLYKRKSRGYGVIVPTLD